jgi:hypothetical protein
MNQTPSEYFNKPVIGTIRVEDVFETGEGPKTYEVIDEDNICFVTNQWYKEYKKIPQLIPKSLDHWTKLY